VAVAVGRLVDDSIVVIENIFRRTQKTGFSVDLIIEATREVARAITSSTLTTIAVFLPIGLLSGSLQSFLLPFALTVTYSLMASLLVALTVVPVMSAWLLKNVQLKPHKESKSLASILQWTLNHKFISVVLSIIVFGGSIGLYATLPKGAVSASDTSFISVSLTYPPEVSVDQVKEKAIELEKFITAQSEAKYTILQQGNSADGAQWGQVTSANRADFSIVMKEDVDAEHFIKQVNEQKKNFTGGDLRVETASFDGSSSSSITLDVTGDNVKDLTTAVAQVTDSIKGIDGITKVTSNQDELKPGYQIVVDPAKANPQQTAMQISSVLNPTPIGSMKYEGKETPVILDALVNPSKQSDLTGIQIMTSEGPKQLSTIASIEQTKSTSSILHKEGQQYLRLTVQVDAKKLSVVDTAIKTKTENLKLPNGVTLLQGGASAQQSSDFMDLFMTMIVSIGVVFLIMVITFKSFRAPIAIILSLPFAAIGAIVAMMITQTSFDITSMFGALMLIGIVVTNAIVLIDRVKQNEQVMTIRDSLLEAAATRMRPILMTAIATICAMLPLLFSKAEEGSIVSQGLAIVVIGGLAAATVLTLVMVPVIYESLHFIKAARERKKQQTTTPNQLSA
jgi:HAE1 family hydrophobic/amphiphilic exporter-1